MLKECSVVSSEGIDGFGVLRELSDPTRAPLVIFATEFERHAKPYSR
jgi:hypothetical protein